MSWQVNGVDEGLTARRVAWVDGRLDGDPASLAAVAAALETGVGVLETPTGPVYQTRGIGDERGAYLLALYLLDHAEVTGDPPATPERAEVGEPVDVVY